MLVVALAAAVAAAQASPPAGETAVSQARATVRLVAGARITQKEVPEGAVVRKTELKAADGSTSIVRLIEFP